MGRVALVLCLVALTQVYATAEEQQTKPMPRASINLAG
jgi:hypothetical protein